ncbi:class I SAM-dependent methyltransferase [Foetidibacter luteolus]|uniref:class I SAM-dependent methyltransferase n=1 Tax=Foetidibacter luteolus TaxID=2608880 RepID=UPI00129B302B|nr:class I SAM-dependent methyltransferase [Foetidibacter luteolus]
MDNGKLQMFQNRLLKVYRHKSKLARRQQVSCYRVYDHDLPEFPFCIELYGDKLYLAEYLRRHGMTDEEHEEWLDNCLALIGGLLEMSVANMYVRQRKRMSHRTQDQYEKLDEEKVFFTVEESGLKFLVNLTDYLDTGLFLDHRITRQMVRDEAKNKRVLNLFCYTGSFSVYAAAGEAAEITSVDLSKTYLNWASDNYKLNAFDERRHHITHADVKQYLKTLQPASFDLVIMDPPTFSNSKRMKDFLDIQRDHAELLNDVLKAVTSNGIIYFSTNFTRFVLDETSIKASSIKDITKATTPFDFEGKLKRYCYKLIK